MRVTKCPNCGSEVDVSGLSESYGGHNFYCVVCGHSWHV